MIIGQVWERPWERRSLLHRSGATKPNSGAKWQPDDGDGASFASFVGRGERCCSASFYY